MLEMRNEFKWPRRLLFLLSMNVIGVPGARAIGFTPIRFPARPRQRALPLVLLIARPILLGVAFVLGARAPLCNAREREKREENAAAAHLMNSAPLKRSRL